MKNWLAQIVGRGESEREAQADGHGGRDIGDRLIDALGRVKPVAR